jgi:hypothetical protein
MKKDKHYRIKIYELRGSSPNLTLNCPVILTDPPKIINVSTNFFFDPLKEKIEALLGDALRSGGIEKLLEQYKDLAPKPVPNKYIQDCSWTIEEEST